MFTESDFKLLASVTIWVFVYLKGRDSWFPSYIKVDANSYSAASIKPSTSVSVAIAISKPVPALLG